MTNSTGGYSGYSDEIGEESRRFQALEKRLVSEATILKGAVYHHFNPDGSFAGEFIGDPLPSDAFERAAARRALRQSETQPVEREVTPPPDKLNAQQVAALTDLIQTNPPNQKWQNAIGRTKKQFPEQLGNVKALDGDKLNFAQFDNFSNKTDLYQKIVNPELKPASATTGVTILTASKKMKSFAVRTENALTNFFICCD